MVSNSTGLGAFGMGATPVSTAPSALSAATQPNAGLAGVSPGTAGLSASTFNPTGVNPAFLSGMSGNMVGMSASNLAQPSFTSSLMANPNANAGALSNPALTSGLAGGLSSASLTSGLGATNAATAALQAGNSPLTGLIQSGATPNNAAGQGGVPNNFNIFGGSIDPSNPFQSLYPSVYGASTPFTPAGAFPFPNTGAQPVTGGGLSPVIGGTPTGAPPISNNGSLGTPADPSVNTQGLNPTNDSQVQASLNRISQDPDGASLIQAAQQKGYQIVTGDPTGSGAAQKQMTFNPNCPFCTGLARDGATTVDGLTRSGSFGNLITISPTARDFDKTLTHELFHAATDADGNSQAEESIANVIGEKVSANVNGGVLENPSDIINRTVSLYPELQAENNAPLHEQVLNNAQQGSPSLLSNL